jgi:hypothetical protein
VAHPKQFDDDDRFLARLREICLAFPGADEKVSHGRPAFFTKKIFVVYGAVTKGDHHSGAHDHAMIFQPESEELLAYDNDDRFFVPAYYGPYGWRAIDLGTPEGDDIAGLDWDEVAELVEESYRQTATAKLVAQLDAERA